MYETVYGNITFAVTTVQDVGDMYFHIEGPAENSWVGFGVGSQMDASLIWVVYRSGDGKGIYFLPMVYMRAPRNSRWTSDRQRQESMVTTRTQLTDNQV